MLCNFHRPFGVCGVCQVLIFPAFLLLPCSAHDILCFALRALSPLLCQESSLAVWGQESPTHHVTRAPSQAHRASWQCGMCLAKSLPMSLSSQWSEIVGFCRAVSFSRSPCWGLPLHLLSYMKFLTGKIHWENGSTVLSLWYSMGI